MRQFGILLILGLVLAFIAFQARTGIFRLHVHEEPANKYMRQMMDNPQLSEEDAAIMRDKYRNAHITPSGLRYVERNPGEGPTPTLGQEVVIHYDGFLLDGTKFDSSQDIFRVGTEKVIKGLDEGVALMKKGEKRTLIVPWWLAYGEAGRSPIPPKATLVLDVELIALH